MMQVIFHGVRGSHPVADVQMAKYGGNTSCVEVVKNNNKGIKTPIIIDAGSGFIKLGYALAGKLLSSEYSRSFPLLFTHLHPDHTEGFNFFVPNFFSFCSLYLMGMETLRKNVGIILKERMIPPTFPIEYKDLKSHRKHLILNDGQVFFVTQEGEPAYKAENPLFEVHVMAAFAPSHPQQGALYYKIIDSEDRSSVACIWDIESHVGGDLRVVNFAQNADVMIHDTMYTEEEYLNAASPVQGFGHSTFAMAIENAEKSHVKYLFPFHYNPRHNDSLLDGIREHWKTRIDAEGSFEFIMSYEGLSLTLDHGKLIQQEKLQMGFSK